MSSITAVIAHYHMGSELRRRNVVECLKSLKELEVPAIVSTNDAVFIRNNAPEAKVLNEMQTQGLFCKSRSYNRGAREAKTDNILFLDADFKMTAQTISTGLSALGDPSVNTVIPYRGVHYMSEDQTLEYLEKGHDAHIHQANGTIAVGGVVLCRRDHYLGSLMDEDFLGWGYEDFEFAFRQIKRKAGFRSINGSLPHMYHESGKGNDVVSAINILLFILKIYYGMGSVVDMGKFRLDVRRLFLQPSKGSQHALGLVKASTAGMVNALASNDVWSVINPSFRKLNDSAPFRELLATLGLNTREFDRMSRRYPDAVTRPAIPSRLSGISWWR